MMQGVRRRVLPSGEVGRATLAAIALWVLRYWLAYGFHLRRPPYWDGWFDQGKYSVSAFALAHGDLSVARHWYPFAYSLLAAPFARIFPGDPFFAVNALLFGCVFAGFAAVVRRLDIGPWPALGVLVLTSLIVDRTAGLWIIPWTTSLSAALIWGALATTMRVVQLGSAGEERSPRDRDWFVLGSLTGAMPLVRPVDTITAAVILLAGAALAQRRRLLGWRAVALVAAGGLLVAVPYGALYLAIYGAAPSQYMVDSAQQGFAFADLPWKAYVLLVTAWPWYPVGTALTEGMPWLVVGMAGLLVTAAKCAAGRDGRVALAFVAVVAVAHVVPFLAYTDLQPTGLWRFNNAHYFKWLFPLFGAGVWVWGRALVVERRPASCLALLACVMLPACLRVVPRRVADDVPARLLTFAGRTDRRFDEAYFAPSLVVDARGTMNNVRHFHQLPDGEGERAVAITRLFDARPRRSDPGEAPRYARDEAPDGRFAASVEIGWPCWIAPTACRGDLPVR